MNAIRFTRFILPAAAACGVAGLMVLSTSRLHAFTPQETVLTREIAIDAINTGLTIDAIACSGATPAQVPAVLEAIRSTNVELQSAVGAAASRTIAQQSYDSIVNQIRNFGLTDDLDTARTDAATALVQQKSAFATAQQAWLNALSESLDGTLSAASINRLANATLNRQRSVPAPMKVLDASSTNWEALEAAYSELDAVEVVDLPEPLRTAWQAALSDQSVIAATADYSANLQAVRTAFVQIVQQLPTE
ncbi:MAG: hypothetical protein ACIAQF_00675 [Phycisphaerales bacterium JB065]